MRALDSETLSEIPVVMAFDKGYLLPSCTAVLSLLEKMNPAFCCHLYILAEEKDRDMDEGLFRAFAERFPSFSWEYRNVSPGGFLHTRLPVGVVSNLCFARMMAAEILPELNRCLYLDGDILVNDDISKLWKMQDDPDFEDCYLAACPDLSLQNGSGEFYVEHRRLLNTENLENYFNSGILIMNLEKIRRDRLLDQFLSLADKGYLFGDQDILYTVCRKHVKMLPVRWNLYPGNIDDESIMRLGCTEEDKADLKTGRAAILHFAGKDKPWNLVETLSEQKWYDCVLRLPETGLTDAWKEKLKTVYHPCTGRSNTIELLRNRSYVLYGFTGISRKLADRLIARGFGMPAFFCDGDPEKQGQTYRGIRCVLPEKILGDPQMIFVLCTQNAWRTVGQELERNGISSERILRYRMRDFAILNCGPEDWTGKVQE